MPRLSAKYCLPPQWMICYEVIVCRKTFTAAQNRYNVTASSPNSSTSVLISTQMDCQKLHDALGCENTASKVPTCPKCLNTQLKTSNMENSEENTLPLRLPSQSHDSTRMTSNAASPQKPSCLNLPRSDVDGQEVQLDPNSDVPQNSKSPTQGNEEINSENNSNENDQSDGQESTSLSVPEKGVHSTTLEPVLAHEDEPPATIEDDVHFLYSVPTRMNRKRQLHKEKQNLEKCVGNSRCFKEENLLGIVKDKVSASESEVSSTLAPTRFQTHISPTDAETQPIPTTPTFQKTKTQEPKEDLKMEDNSALGDRPTTPKTTQCSLGLPTPSPSVTGVENAPGSGPRSSTSVSPKIVQQQGVSHLPGVAQVHPHSSMKATPQPYPIAMLNLSPEQQANYQRALAKQYQMYQPYPAPQAMAFQQYMMSQSGQMQGYGMLQPQGPQMPLHMQGMSQPGGLKTFYPPGSNFVNTAQLGSGFRGNPILFNPNSSFPPTPPVTPEKQTTSLPQNATNPASTPMDSYPTGENIQRRPTLYGTQWPAGINPTQSVGNNPLQVPKCPATPNGSPQYPRSSTTINSQLLAQPMSHGSPMTAQPFVQFPPTRQPYSTGYLQGAPPLQALTQPYSSPYPQPTQQSRPKTAAMHTATTSTPTIPSGIASVSMAEPPKQSENLLIDIALTTQYVFPFALMASRHGVSAQKVKDIFSAVIQIPLLKHASDPRRYGSLGRERMKQWKAMNKETEELHREVNELNGVAPKPGPAKRGRKRKVDLIEASTVQPHKLQKVDDQRSEEQKSEEAAMWVGRFMKDRDASVGDMANSGDAATGK